jgi:RNA polymerase sigma factor (sigma-70 family)
VSQGFDASTELLRRWQDDGDTDALNELLANEIVVLKHMIRGKRGGALGGSASTSDIAQEAAMGLLRTRKPPTFDDPRALRGYLWRSAWHLLVNRYEKKKRKPVRVDLEDSQVVERFMKSARSLDGIDVAERAMALGVALNLLAKQDRELIRLVYFEGEDIGTAASAVGLSRVAASSRLSRGRRLMATRLAEWSDLIG